MRSRSRMHANSTSETTKMQPKRLARLQCLLDRMEQGLDVAKRDLKSALTEEEWLTYEERRAEELENRNIEPPPKIKKYLNFKAKADLALARANAYHQRPFDSKNRATERKMYEHHSHLVDCALEYLSECLVSNQGLAVWLTVEEPFSNVLEAIRGNVMPQAITSRTSRCSSRSPYGQLSIRELKKDTIESAIFSLTEQPVVELITLPSAIAKSRLDFSKFKV